MRMFLFIGACLRLTDQNAYTFCLALSLRIAACGVFNDSRHKELCYTTRLQLCNAIVNGVHEYSPVPHVLAMLDENVCEGVRIRRV